MTDTRQPAIELRQLHKAFGDQIVLNGVDLAIREGETVAVMGRSGTGKSIMLKLIIGLQKPDAGSVFVHGHEIPALTGKELRDVRAKVGFLFQEAALYDSLSLEENVAFPLRRQQAMKPAEIRDRVHQLLDVVGMQSDAPKLPAEISGGMKKRVGIARALALDPDVLLFDEPTAGLDPITAGEIGELIVKLRHERRVTSLVVTHDVHGAKTVADRFAFLDRGAIVATGTFEELSQNKNEVVSRFLRDAG